MGDGAGRDHDGRHAAAVPRGLSAPPGIQFTTEARKARKLTAKDKNTLLFSVAVLRAFRASVVKKDTKDTKEDNVSR